MNSNLIKHFFLTSKPYSYAGEVSRGILYSLLLSPTNKILAISISASISFLMWLYFNWQSDFIQQDIGRIRPPKILFLIPLLIAMLISTYLGGIIGFSGIVIYSLSIVLYSFKAKNSFLGIIGPFLRFLNGMALLIAVAFCLRLNLTINTLFIALIVSLYLAIRNLIGDVRDIKNDKWEIPARFGMVTTLKIVRGGFIILLLSYIFLALKEILPFYGVIIIILSILFSEIAIVRFDFNKPHIWGYIMHRILVILLPVFHLTILLSMQ